MSSEGKLPSLYLAGPLFSKAELDFNVDLRNKLSRWFDVFLPQEDGQLLVKLIESGFPANVASKRIFENDISELKKAEYLLIVLDGRSIDEGAAFELGYAFSLGKKCYGLKTDPRVLLRSGDNPMIENALLETFETIEKLLIWARNTSTSYTVG